uniref:Thioredoxin domain-containing protein n=1 Tax=viral metagenome TaxID=1070528 RepID=A0A6C0D080_9ZZZZ
MSIVVCLYSKYSEKCRSFLEYVSTTPLDMKMLCIDNENVRKLLEKDEPRYRIRMVPCLLIFQMNGVMEKKEGFESFEYVQQILKELRHVPNPIVFDGSNTTPMIPVNSINSINSTNAINPSSHAASIQNMENMERFGPVPPMPHPSLPLPTSPNSNQTFTEKFDTIDEVSSELPTEAQYVTKKKENILTLAATMAKQRESEDEKMNPNPYAKAQEAQEAIMTRDRKNN